MFHPDMDGSNARPLAERSGSMDSDASVSELRPSPGESSESSPSPSAQSTQNEPELPEDLKAQGWTVHYSMNHKRFYFYHPGLKESYWYISDVRMHARKRMQDALMIDQKPSTSPPTPTTPPKNLGPSFGYPMKRFASELIMEVAMAKRPHLDVPFYNFDIPTGVYILERKPLHIPRSHPDTELLRNTMFTLLRKKYGEMLHTREGIEPPPGSLHRWMLERKVLDKGIDPVFPSICQPESSRSLAREIMNHLPMALVKPKYAADARKQLIKYAEAAQRFMERRSVDAEARKKVLFTCGSMMTQLRKEAHMSLDAYMNRQNFLKRECQAPIQDAAEQSVMGLTSKLYNQCVTYAAEVYEVYKKIASDQNHTMEDRWKIPERMERKCYPIYLSHPILTHPPVEVVRDLTDQVKFIYKKETVSINKTHLCKLESLYHHSHPDDSDFQYFPSRTWCLLMRYQMLFGPAVGDAKSLQAALPTAIFEVLHRVFGVTFECFASPLNCYFKQYCSAFPDTDTYFGSRGSILDFKPIKGSLQANPPWCEELIEATIDHFETLLADSDQPLSFIVFLPDFRDPPPEFLIKVEESRFKRRSVLLQAFEHEYRDGLQHIGNGPNPTSSHGTSVYFLQNDAGFKKWPPTAEGVNELVRASLIKS